MLKTVLLLATLTFSSVAVPTTAGAETLPTLLIGEKIVPFDSAFETALSASEESRIRSSVEAVVQSAIDQGVSRIGSIELQKLKADLRTVKLRAIGRRAVVVAIGFSSARAGAAYITETRTVFVNTVASSDNPTREFSEDLYLHEFVGALGIDDQSYQFSTLLRSAAEEKVFIQSLGGNFPTELKHTPTQMLFRDQKFDQKLDMNNLPRRNGSGLILRKGGISVVGGGGDELLASVKFELLKEFPLFKKTFALLSKRQPESFAEIQTKLSKPIDAYDSEEVYAEFKKFVLKMPIELLTFKYGLREQPLSDVASTDDKVLDQELAGAMRVVVSADGVLFLRFSRAHWTMPITGQTLEVSRRTMVLLALVQVYGNWLKEVHENSGSLKPTATLGGAK